MEALFRARPVFLAAFLFIGGCSAILPEGWETVDSSTLHRRYLPPGSPGRAAVPGPVKENASADDPGYAAKVMGMLFVNSTTAGQ